MLRAKGAGHEERISRSLTPPPLRAGVPEVLPGHVERRRHRDRRQRLRLRLRSALQLGPINACFLLRVVYGRFLGRTRLFLRP